jgi:protein-tyrosine phosphatase
MTHECQSALAERETPNLRDTGGLALDGGGLTRTGVLLRSAAPHDGDRVPATLSDVVDLRSPGELGAAGHPWTELPARIHAIPLLTGDPQPSADELFADLGATYRDFLDEGAEKIVRVLAIATRATGPMLVHCAAGKDRTGIVVAVLLRAAGATRESVTADYVATGAHMDAVLARESRRVAKVDPTVLQKMMGAPAEAIEAVLDELDRVPGGAAGWLVRRGAEPADIETWRRRIA